jgi:hypothetical protein
VHPPRDLACRCPPKGPRPSEHLAASRNTFPLLGSPPTRLSLIAPPAHVHADPDQPSPAKMPCGHYVPATCDGAPKAAARLGRRSAWMPFLILGARDACCTRGRSNRGRRCRAHATEGGRSALSRKSHAQLARSEWAVPWGAAVPLTRCTVGGRADRYRPIADSGPRPPCMG